MPVSIDTYGFRKTAAEFSDEEEKMLRDRMTSGACLGCGGETEYEYYDKPEFGGGEEERISHSSICNSCTRQLAEKGESALPRVVVDHLYRKIKPEMYTGDDLQGWAQNVISGDHKNMGEDEPLGPMETPMNPKQIEDKYRQVGEDEWHYERTGPVSSRTMEKLYPGSQPKNLQDLNRPYSQGPQPEYSDWLEMMEPGSVKKPDDEETYLKPIKTQLSIRQKVAGMTTQQERDMAEKFLEKQKHEKTEVEMRDERERERLRSQRRRDDETIEEGESSGLLAKPGAMCANHKDIPASFVLQTQILKQSGMAPRMMLCPFCASKLDIVDLSRSEAQTCINAEHHVENSKSDPMASKMLVHDGVIDKDAPPLPLCKDCASPFSIIVRPLNEEAEVKYSKMVPLANRDRKAYVLNQLMKLANMLDSKGLYAEANEIDGLIRQAGEWDKEYGSHLPPGEWKAETEGFMRDMETGQRAPAFLDDMVCPDCQEPMPLEVQRSGGGYYLGRTCKNCGPWGRDSGYFKSEKDAEKALEEYKNR